MQTEVLEIKNLIELINNRNDQKEMISEIKDKDGTSWSFMTDAKIVRQQENVIQLPLDED